MLDESTTEGRGGQVLTGDLKQTATGADGLSREEARVRLQQYGYTEIPEWKTNVFLKFLTYFWGRFHG